MPSNVKMNAINTALPNVSSSELLDERLSRRVLAEHLQSPEKVSAFFDAALIAIQTVYRAAEAGNVQCREAVKRIEPKLGILLTK